MSILWAVAYFHLLIDQQWALMVFCFGTLHTPYGVSGRTHSVWQVI